MFEKIPSGLAVVPLIQERLKLEQEEEAKKHQGVEDLSFSEGEEYGDEEEDKEERKDGLGFLDKGGRKPKQKGRKGLRSGGLSGGPSTAATSNLGGL